MMVASFLLMMADSLPDLIFSPSAPLIFSAFSSTFSRVTYSVEQLGRGFFANTGDARDIIYGIPHQS